MTKRLASAVLTAAALTGAFAPAADAVQPAERFNAPGQRHVNVCVRLNTTSSQLRFADASPTGFRVANGNRFDEDGRCPNGTLRIDLHEQIPSVAGPLVFHRGGNGYADAANVKYGQLATTEIATPLPAPTLSRGGRGAPCDVAAGPAWRAQVRSIPEQMHYKRPQDVPNGSNRGASFEHYGDPGADQGDRDDIHYSYLLWSLPNVRGGGIVRTLIEPSRLVRPCDVAPVTMNAWDRSGKVNGQVTARYVKTVAGNCPLYGWMVWTHRSHDDDGGPVAHSTADPAAPAVDPPLGAGCPVQEPAKPPAVATGPVSAVTEAAAGLHGSVDPAGVFTTYRFQYGPTPAYGAVTRAITQGPDITAVPVFAGIAGLRPGTTYHYRLVATNSHGTTAGPDATFTTAAVPPAPELLPAVTVGDLRLRPSVFKAAHRRKGRMTWIRWTASLPGPARFTFQRRTAGVRVRGTCRPAPRRGLPRKARRCARWSSLRGSLTAAVAKPGKSRRVFSGWVGSRRLTPGTYRLTATLVSYDGRTGTPRRTRFRIRP